MNFQALIWQEPWLSPVIMNLRNVIATKEIETAGVTPDGKTLFYNPKWWGKLTPQKRLIVQIHEMLHIVNLHAKRRDYRTHNRWNIACDIAINHQIRNSGYNLPRNMLRGENDTAENIYKCLPKETNEYFMCGDLLKRNLDGSDDCVHIETLEAVESAIKLAGRGSTLLSKSFVPSKSKADWRTVLQNLVKSIVGDEFDYITYEFDEFGVCEDILEAKPRSEICVLVDESGSISDELYSQFLAELFKISKFAEVYASGFTDGTELNAIPLKEYARTMTGGTNVLVAYEQACNKHYDCIIILTDGCLSFPQIEQTQTIWAMSESFGRKFEVIL
jgi:predicted metal-dependent peptidase